MCIVYKMCHIYDLTESADDFCTSEPQSDIINLPEGCLYEGSATIDKGSCETNPCYGGETNECTSRVTHCCGPTSLSRVEVDCGTYTLPIFSYYIMWL